MLNWIVWNRTVYLSKIDMALNNQQMLICHKTQTNKKNIQATFVRKLYSKYFSKSISIKTILKLQRIKNKTEENPHT